MLALAFLCLLPACRGKESPAESPESSEEAFLKAAEERDLEMVKKYIAAGGKVDARGRYGRTALHLAIMRDHEDIVKLLLDAGADPNVADEKGKTCLHWAVWNTDSTMSEMLIGGGADVNAVDNEGRTPLDAAMDCKFPHLAMRLAEHGARTVKTPPRNIAEAAMVGQIEAVKDILAAGCDVNAKDKRGYAALHYAAMRNDRALCELLIDHGADCDAHTDAGHDTPLHLADSPEIVRLLAASGADMDATALYGWTALYRAVYDDNIERAELLIEEGADVNAPYAREPATPLDAAKSEAMKALLRDHRALSYKDLTEEEKAR